jgi:hypothetical protein
VALTTRAADLGLTVLASAAWPESASDHTAPPLAGFVASAFSPIVAEVAKRCLVRRPPMVPAVTAVIVISALGDVTSAVRVAEAVDHGDRVWPLMFFQSVPNAVAGHVASRWQLEGPVVCVGDVEAGVDIAALLIDDRDAGEALLVDVDIAHREDMDDRAAAVLVTAGGPT